MSLNWKSVICIVTLVNLGSYFSIRQLLWSIVWLSIRGNQKRLRIFKQDMRKQESLWNQISMRYLTEHLKLCRDDFQFWLRVKYIFTLVEIIFEVAYSATKIFLEQTRFFEVLTVFLLIQAMVIFLLFQVPLNRKEGRLTKYDLMRIKRK